MSQLVLDDQLDVVKVLPGLRRWASTIRLQELRPGEHIFDDRVPEILLTCHEPTFVTIDSDFWKPKLCHSGYCIVYTEIDFRRQQEIPKLLRRLFRHARFKSHAQRMGKVIRLTQSGVSFWESAATTVQHVLFGPAAKKRRRKT
jgi:hypothetical protein